MKHVLLVEDDAWLAESYQRTLEAANFRVSVAYSADEAMRHIETDPPQVIVVDIVLEGHTAIGLLHELQSYNDTEKIPVIVCSSLAHPALHADKLHSYGVRSVVDKATLTPEQFVLTVREVTAS